MKRLCMLLAALCLCGAVALAEQARPAETDAGDWRGAYLDRLAGTDFDPDGEYGYTYGLIYVDADDVPELFIDTQIEASGCVLLTFHDGELGEMITARRGFTYLERENLLCNSDGVMGYYYDGVYTIRDGQWTLLAEGAYTELPAADGGAGESGDTLCRTYSWNGVETTEEDYEAQYHALYDVERALTPPEGVTLEQMRALLLEP